MNSIIGKQITKTIINWCWKRLQVLAFLIHIINSESLVIREWCFFWKYFSNFLKFHHHSLWEYYVWWFFSNWVNCCLLHKIMMIFHDSNMQMISKFFQNNIILLLIYMQNNTCELFVQSFIYNYLDIIHSKKWIASVFVYWKISHLYSEM